MMNGIHFARIAHLVAPAGVLFALAAFAVAGAEPPSALTHLFRVSVPDRGLVVFLPESEIASESDAVAYLRWARETFPKEAKDGSLDVVWDSDGIALRVPQQDDACFLREGDDALDASGNVAFRVKAMTNGTDVVLCPKDFPEPGTATPALCLTNAWVLSREHLRERIANDLATNRPPASVRKEVSALRRRFLRERDADVADAWLSDFSSFVSNAPALWPAIRATNRTDRPVAVSIGGRPAEILAAGEMRPFRLESWPAGEKVSWSALDAGEGLCDKDFSTPAEGELKWDALAASDLPLPLEGALGVRLPKPRLRLPALLPVSLSREDATALRVSVGYADRPHDSIPATVHFEREGELEIEIEPHRGVRSLCVEADGWETLAVDAGLPGVCSADEPRLVSLGGRKMVPHAEPWPTLVVRNESGAPALLRSRELFGDGQRLVAAGSTTNIVPSAIPAWGPDLADGSSVVRPNVVSERKIVLNAVADGKGGELLATNLVVRRGGAPIKFTIHAPKPENPLADVPSVPAVAVETASASVPCELPSSEEIDGLKDYLRQLQRPATGDNENSSSVKKARGKLDPFFTFWNPDPSAEQEVFGRIVAHFAVCRECDDCRSLCRQCGKVGRNSTLDPKTEAFEVLIGWGEEDENLLIVTKTGQRTYRKELLKRLGAEAAWPFSDADPEKAERRKSSLATRWVQIVRGGLGGSSKKEGRENALHFWNGETDAGKTFRCAYIHLELCDDSACPCAPYRSALRRAPTFDDRRKALLAAFVCDSGLLDGKSEKPLSADELDLFVKSMQTEQDRK